MQYCILHDVGNKSKNFENTMTKKKRKPCVEMNLFPPELAQTRTSPALQDGVFLLV